MQRTTLYARSVDPFRRALAWRIFVEGKAVRQRVKDDETSLHLKDPLFELERGR